MWYSEITFFSVEISNSMDNSQGSSYLGYLQFTSDST